MMFEELMSEVRKGRTIVIPKVMQYSLDGGFYGWYKEVEAYSAHPNICSIENAIESDKQEVTLPEPQNCPRCRSRSKLIRDRWVRCLNPGCNIIGPNGDTPEDAIKEWNRLSYKEEE